VTQASPIEAITLDLDGTLYSILRMVLRNPFTMVPVLRVFRDLHRIRFRLRGLGPFRDFRREQARLLAKKRRISEDKAARLVQRVIDQRWMKVFTRVRLFDGVQDTLETLHRRGVRIGVVSDYPVAPKLAGIGLTDFPFAALVNSEEVGALKPHPAPFQKASELLGMDPEKILHVGDREDCDVAGAQLAGFRAALFHRGKSAIESRADFTFSDWKQFVPILLERGYLLK
jgi:putative hydrolase of the HAD superfamily